MNREYIELITGSIKRIADFLNSFDMSCRSRLSVLNEKLTYLGNLVSNIILYIIPCTLHTTHNILDMQTFRCVEIKSCNLIEFYLQRGKWTIWRLE